MILRKPFAFLIKHFKKINFILLVCTIFIFIKQMSLSAFINDYIKLGVYNAYVDNINNYASVLFYIVSIFIIVSTLILIYLLKLKKKPALFYVITTIEYLIVMTLFIYISSYFNTILEKETTMINLAIKDLLLITSIPQYLIMVLLSIRSLGLDLKKFGFDQEAEFEILEQDREEFEVQLEVDKDDIKRKFKKRFRYLKYFYVEHARVLNTIISIILIGLITYTYYYFGILNKTYKEEETFTANNYKITITDSYITNKSFQGDELTNKNFVIVNVDLINNGVKREVDLEKFMLMNKEAMILPTEKYNNYFKDLGTTLKTKTLRKNEKVNFILIYQVDTTLNNNDFALYYQDIPSLTKLKLKKVKLNVKEISQTTIKEAKTLGEKIEYTLSNKETKSFTINNVNFLNTTTYYYEKCIVYDCSILKKEINTNKFPDSKIMQITFDSTNLNGKELIDFLVQYGKINYENKEGMISTGNINSAVDISYTGNYLYLVVPNNVINEKYNIYLTWTVRNDVYKYQLN